LATELEIVFLLDRQDTRGLRQVLQHDIAEIYSAVEGSVVSVASVPGETLCLWRMKPWYLNYSQCPRASSEDMHCTLIAYGLSISYGGAQPSSRCRREVVFDVAAVRTTGFPGPPRRKKRDLGMGAGELEHETTGSRNQTGGIRSVVTAMTQESRSCRANAAHQLVFNKKKCESGRGRSPVPSRANGGGVVSGWKDPAGFAGAMRL
jgi:hypothetical protein